MTLGRLFGDRLTGRYGAINMLMANGILMASGFILAASFPTLLTAILGFVLIGLGSSIVVPVVFSLAAQSKMPPAYALTAVTLLGYSGFLIAPLLIGTLSDLLSMQWAFGLVSFFGLGIFFLSAKVKGLQQTNQ
jgi:MFS family permease